MLASSFLQSAKAHKTARMGCVHMAPHHWNFQASISLEQEGRKFGSQIAVPRWAMKWSLMQLYVGTKNLEMLMCDFAQPEVSRPQAMFSPAREASGSPWNNWIPHSFFMLPASLKSVQKEDWSPSRSPSAPRLHTVPTHSVVRTTSCRLLLHVTSAGLFMSHRYLSQLPQPHREFVAPSYLHLPREEIKGKNKKETWSTELIAL